LAGWQVEIADAEKAKGLALLACTTDPDRRLGAGRARPPRDLVPAIWLPDPLVRAERERARWRLHVVRHRSSLKPRVHAVLLSEWEKAHRGLPRRSTERLSLTGRRGSLDSVQHAMAPNRVFEGRAVVRPLAIVAGEKRVRLRDVGARALRPRPPKLLRHG